MIEAGWLYALNTRLQGLRPHTEMVFRIHCGLNFFY
jgi:hypothetical protein